MLKFQNTFAAKKEKCVSNRIKQNPGTCEVNPLLPNLQISPYLTATIQNLDPKGLCICLGSLRPVTLCTIHSRKFKTRMVDET